jgi:hypothetical protein
MKQENEKYCTECGEIINIKAEIVQNAELDS